MDKKNKEMFKGEAVNEKLVGVVSLIRSCLSKSKEQYNVQEGRLAEVDATCIVKVLSIDMPSYLTNSYTPGNT